MNILLESPVNVMRFYVRGVVYRVACADIIYSHFSEDKGGFCTACYNDKIFEIGKKRNKSAGAC